MPITGGRAIDHVKTARSGCLRLYRIRTPPVRHDIDASRDEGSPCPPIASISSSLPARSPWSARARVPDSLGLTFLRNLIAGGFEGEIFSVNPHHVEIEGRPCFPSLSALPEVPDLMIVAVPPARVLGVIEEACEVGVSAAIVATAGMGYGANSLGDQVRLAARAHGLRIVGPNCIGVLAPRAKMNASFAARSAKPGDLALVSQSGAVAAGLVEWAAQRHVGFSAIVSLGDKVDVDFSDCLDFFAADAGTRAILLYIESIDNAQKFMSAARAAARVKPVVVIKAGRHAQGAKAAATHTGALAGSDAVYDAAFRRAGLLRVLDLDQLFAAAETLGRQKPFPGNRLAVLTNGGGIGVLAVDRLIDLGGTLAALSETTRAALDAFLPPTWSHANPIDIIGDADPARYAGALEALLADPENDAILILNVPTAIAGASDVAAAIADVVRKDRAKGYRQKPVFAAWIGEDPDSARVFEEARIPHFATEADAVRGLHSARALPGGAGTADGNAGQPSARFRARHRGGPGHRRPCVSNRTAAGSIRSRSTRSSRLTTSRRRRSSSRRRRRRRQRPPGPSSPRAGRWRSRCSRPTSCTNPISAA